MTTSTPALYAGARSAEARAGTSRASAAGGNWYSALSRAWGQALDTQATRVVRLSQGLAYGEPGIGDVMLVTTESSLMGVMSQSAATVNNSIGQALETLARK
jgi:hypothetical protein